MWWLRLPLLVGVAPALRAVLGRTWRTTTEERRSAFLFKKTKKTQKHLSVIVSSLKSALKLQPLTVEVQEPQAVRGCRGLGCKEPLAQQDLAQLSPGPQDTVDPETHHMMPHDECS